MFDTVCTYPLNSDLLAQAIHPDAPLLALGLASGVVQLQRLPPSDPPKGHGTIETVWRTRRHKGSCRSLCFSHDGGQLLSAGSDGIVKIAHTETGNVEAKIGVPLFKSKIDPTCILHALSPQTLLLATDSSALYLYDLRASPSSAGSKPQQTHHPHDDYISSLTPIPPGDASTSGLSKQWVSTGGNTVAVTDLRRGILVKSEDQEEELLSSNIVGNKLVVGDAKGVLRMWEVGVWDDNEETVGLGKGASADVLTAVPEGLGNEQMAAVGMDDGYIRLVAMGGKRAKVVVELRHDEVEGVGALGFEVGGRMISGGGAVVKVWEENLGGNEGDEADNDIENGGEERGAENGKRANGSGSDKNDGSEVGGDESSDEEKPKRKKKKRKRNKGKDRSGGQHVMAFKGLD